MADDKDQIGQDEIEALLSQAQEVTDGGGGGEAEAEPSAPAGGEDDGAFSLGQDEIEALMSGGSMPAPSAAPAPEMPAAPAAPAAAQPAGGYAPQPAAPMVGGTTNDVELLLNQAQEAIASIDGPGDQLPDGVEPFRLEGFGGAPANNESATLELVRDVQLDLKIELGRTRMPLEDVLRLRREAVVTLDKLAGDPVDVYVNGRLIARGEVLVLNDNFCVRITELIVGDAAVA